MKNKKYITFQSTRLFLRALPLVESQKIVHRVVSMPNHLSDECGMVLEIDTNQEKAIENLLTQYGIDFLIKE